MALPQFWIWGCKKICVNGHLAGNCRLLERIEDDRIESLKALEFLFFRNASNYLIVTPLYFYRYHIENKDDELRP